MKILKNIMILPAAGSGKRMGANMPKQFLALAGKPLFVHALEALEAAQSVDGVVVVMPENDLPLVQELIRSVGFRKVLGVVDGGAARQDSVANGLSAVPASAELIGVHDGVRSLVTPALVDKVIDAAKTHGAAVPCLPVVDTVKTVDGDQIVQTLDRSTLVRVQTPQVFKAEWLREAYQNADAEGFTGTDDASLVERAGHAVFRVAGEENNIKITTPMDLQMAHWILETR